MTDQLASARGRIKNIRNIAKELRYWAVHEKGTIEGETAGDLQQAADYISDEVNAALETIESVENSDDDRPPGDYYVLTPDCATLNDATRFDREIDAVLVAASHHEPTEVVHRPNRP